MKKYKKGGTHIVQPYMAGKSGKGTRVGVNKSRENLRLIRAETLCAVCGYAPG